MYFKGMLQKKICFCLILFVLLPVVLINSFFQFYLRNIIVTSINESFENSVSNIDREIQTIMNEVSLAMNVVSNDPEVHNSLLTAGTDYKSEIKARSLLVNKMSLVKSYIFYFEVDFIILDANSNLYSTYFISDPSKLSSTEAKEWVEQINLNGNIFTWISTTMDALGGDSKKNVLCICKTVKNYNNQILGQVISIIDEDKLYKLIQNFMQYKEGSIFLSDSKGSIYLAKDKNDISRNISEVLDKSPDHLINTHILKNKLVLTSIMPKTIVYEEINKIYMKIIMADIFLSLFFVLITFIVVSTFLKPISHLRALMAQIEIGNFDVSFKSRSHDELSVLGESFNKMVRNLEILIKNDAEQRQKIMEQENEKEKIKYMVLQSQINPHFLFNALNNIKWLALMNEDRAVADNISSFGRLLEANMRIKGDEITLRQELDCIKDYLKVMQLHHSQTISLATKLEDEELLDCRILKLLLQPIIENSILHGLKALPCHGYIDISCSQAQGRLICKIHDNGVGIPPEKISSILSGNQEKDRMSMNSIGLYNTLQRIKLFYGNEYGLDIESSPENGTTVTVIVPLLK